MPEENVGGANAGNQPQPAAPAAGDPPAGGGNAPAPAAAAPAAPAPDAATPQSGAETPKPGDPAGAATPIAPDWPADWRTKAAAGDDATVKMLERFASPLDLVKKIREQEKLISSGQIKQPLAKDATAEQVAEYRKQNGIPETFDKYEIKLAEGLKMGEEDKPVMDAILGAAHASNAPPEIVNAMVNAYYQQEKLFNEQLEGARDSYHQSSEDILRAEWGGEFRNEVGRVNNLLATFPDDARAALQDGKDNNGMRLLDNAGLMRGLASLSRMLNPVTTVVPGSGGDQALSVETEMKAIEDRMAGGPNKDKAISDAYYKDEKAQSRYRELVAWNEGNKKKSA